MSFLGLLVSFPLLISSTMSTAASVPASTLTLALSEHRPCSPSSSPLLPTATPSLVLGRHEPDLGFRPFIGWQRRHRWPLPSPPPHTAWPRGMAPRSGRRGWHGFRAVARRGRRPPLAMAASLRLRSDT
ncbi:hypothetical protein SORBI_3001G272000 [Sorghum bicolor]|uniref:Secreted protein n=1 Tax=Sorghum bicolor TaxID=4558 RepID=A0A1Z5S837_SORBI|nr:hypothetical protein SORBI_3001G272000 [Sorghum bicolor]